MEYDEYRDWCNEMKFGDTPDYARRVVAGVHARIADTPEEYFRLNEKVVAAQQGENEKK